MLQNRMECQLRTPCEPRTGREHAHCTIRHTPGKPLEAIAAETAIPLKRLTKISAPQGDTAAKPEEIAAICRATGRFEWMRFFVRLAGCELFELPPAGLNDLDAEVFERTAASLRSLSAVVDMLRGITADRHVTSEERAAFDDITGKHLAIVRQLQQWVEVKTAASVRGIPRIGRGA